MREFFCRRSDPHGSRHNKECKITDPNGSLALLRRRIGMTPERHDTGALGLTPDPGQGRAASRALES